MTDRVIDLEALDWYHSHVASLLQFARSPRSRGALHVRAPEKHRAVPSWGVGTGTRGWELVRKLFGLFRYQNRPQGGVFFTLSLAFALDDRLNHLRGRGHVTFHVGQVNAAESAPGCDVLKAEPARGGGSPHRMESEAEPRRRKF